MKKTLNFKCFHKDFGISRSRVISTVKRFTHFFLADSKILIFALSLSCGYFGDIVQFSQLSVMFEDACQDFFFFFLDWFGPY